jgi:intergrase/recombinase
VESVRLINDKEAFPKYYDPETMTLNHWKFRQFLRTTKKAFLSFITPQMLEPIQNLGEVPTYSAIRHVCNKMGMSCDMRFCRKIHASWLHKCGVASEIIDFIQARTSTSVLSRHYLTPPQGLKDQILKYVHELKKEIEK